jgi:hypothetical protein
MITLKGTPSCPMQQSIREIGPDTRRCTVAVA